VLYVQTTKSFSPRRHQITHSTSTRNERRRAEEVIIICFPGNCIRVNDSLYTHTAVVRKIRECIYICVCVCRRKSHDLPQFFRRSTYGSLLYYTRTHAHTHTYIINIQRVLDALEVKRHTDVFCFVITVILNIIHIYFIILRVLTYNFIAFVRRSRFDDYRIENIHIKIY